jgi:hypothetical protein
MTTAIQAVGLDDATMLALVSGGDTSRLTAAQKTAYYLARCETAGLDPRAQPFAYMRLQGKETLYATKACSEQLAAKHGLRVTITDQRTEDWIRIVVAHVEAKDGRVTEEIGALAIKGLQGEALANALMKCVTKAKRRAVLSICGLGALDETEVESIPGAEVVATGQAGVPVKVESAPSSLPSAATEARVTLPASSTPALSPEAVAILTAPGEPDPLQDLKVALAGATTLADLNRIGKGIRNYPEELHGKAYAMHGRKVTEIKGGGK